jgi:hypothetical protein
MEAGLVTYTILVFLTGMCLAWVLLNEPHIRTWALREGPKSLMINLIAGLILLAVTGGFAIKAASSPGVTPPKSSTLASTPPTSSPSMTPPAPTASTTSSSLRYQGPVNVTPEGRSLDGLPTSNNPPVDLHFREVSKRITPSDNAKVALWGGSQSPSQQDCLTAIATQNLPAIEAVRPGVQFCAKTNDGRFAYLKVINVGDLSVQLDASVWEKF